MSKPIEVLVTGTFNIVHVGHIELLEYAFQFGLVTVGINGDEYQQLKYKDLAIPSQYRKRVLEACRYVHRVVVFDEAHPGDLIKTLRPRYYVKGPDYFGKDIPEIEDILSVDCKLLIAPGSKICNGSEIKHCLEISPLHVLRSSHLP